MAIQPPHLTLISDTSRFTGEAFFDTVQQALIGGVDAILVREKSLDSAKLLALAARLRMMTNHFNVRLIIHSQVDIALAVNADGVHLASQDIAQVAVMRQYLMSAEKTVSVSCHNARELQQAHALCADYALLSPVFPTHSHPGAAHMGTATFNRLKASAKIPVIALGGILMQNCHTLHGQSLAVIGAILDADDPKLAAQHLMKTAMSYPFQETAS